MHINAAKLIALGVCAERVDDFLNAFRSNLGQPVKGSQRVKPNTLATVSDYVELTNANALKAHAAHPGLNAQWLAERLIPLHWSFRTTPSKKKALRDEYTLAQCLLLRDYEKTVSKKWNHRESKTAISQKSDYYAARAVLAVTYINKAVKLGLIEP